MRIAFVGKGGSGKTTLTALFTQYVAYHTRNNIWLVDADLNMHLGDMLGIAEPSVQLYLSSSSAQDEIRQYLRGENKRIETLGHFKKTTPPTRDSSLVTLAESDNYIFEKFATKKGNIHLSVVGTYQEDGIGTSCYHNNLSILENILSHTIDTQSYIVVDMVAGIDAFAGTLHAQFDALVLSVEPTARSVQVYEQYKILAREAGVENQLYIVANKVRDEKDKDFIAKAIPADRLLGYIEESEHIREVDKGMFELSFRQMRESTIATLGKIQQVLCENVVSPDMRLHHLFELHKTYVAQGYIKDRFGDLTHQIDTSFHFKYHVK